MYKMRENDYYVRDTCRLCESTDLSKVLSLAPTALCDAYVRSDMINRAQGIYPLDLFLCNKCGYVFLPCVVNPEIIYRDYLYVTQSSLGLASHFRDYAHEVLSRVNPAKGSLIVDIGSNDGTLLGFFKEQGMRVLGVEPAEKIAKEATDKGITTLAGFFTPQLALKIRKDYSAAKIITINNLLANIDDLEDMAQAIRNLMSDDSVFVMESSYLADMIKNMVFDFIYHEHISYFSVKPLIRFFRRFGMELFDLEWVDTKGGSLRYYFRLSSVQKGVSSSIEKFVKEEEKLGLNRPGIFEDFNSRIEARKKELLVLLNRIKAEGKTIVGYGGSATSTTFIYHFGLGKIMEYIVDDNLAKQNTFSPGLHIPVLPSRVLYEKRPDYILVLAWRYAGAIIEKHRKYLLQGGKFITPLPELKVVP